MKLIATMGSKIENKVKYKLNDKVYEAYCSFLALKEHYNLKNDDIIIIGTKETKNAIKNAKELIGEFELIDLDEFASSNDSELLFSFIDDKVANYLGNDVILDLTQGFRHHPISLFASAILSKYYRPKEIFYAKDISGTNTEFEYINLINVLNNSNIAILVDTYIKNGGVAYISNPSKEVDKFINHLSKLSKSLLVNQYKKVIEKAKILNKFIDEFKKPSLNDKLNKLRNDINTLINLEKEPEYVQLLSLSKYLKDKDLLTQSVQFLFEGIQAFVEFYILKVNPDFTIEIKVWEKDREVSKSVKISDDLIYKRELYKRRNSIKKEFTKRSKNNRYSNIFGDKFNKLQNMLITVDRKRNDISHPNDESEISSTNFSEFINSELKNLEKIITDLNKESK